MREDGVSACHSSYQRLRSTRIEMRTLDDLGQIETHCLSFTIENRLLRTP